MFFSILITPFQNGLTGPQPVIGALIIESRADEIGKAFLFVRKLPFKMPVTLGIAGLHNVLALLLITFINLISNPIHKLLSFLQEKCDERNSYVAFQQVVLMEYYLGLLHLFCVFLLVQ